MILKPLLEVIQVTICRYMLAVEKAKEIERQNKDDRCNPFSCHCAGSVDGKSLGSFEKDFLNPPEVECSVA